MSKPFRVMVVVFRVIALAFNTVYVLFMLIILLPYILYSLVKRRIEET